MPQAPLILSTGAISRYPLARKFKVPTREVVFADYSRQRAAQVGNPLGAWVLNLSLMQDSEANDWLDFWKQQQLAASSFSFIDPADNLLRYSEAQENSPWGVSGAVSVGKNYALYSSNIDNGNWI